MAIFKEKSNFKLYKGDCNRQLMKLNEKSVDLIFADPPYLLSNDGITCSNGRMVSVNKGEWDKSNGFKEDVKFHKKWLKSCDRVLKDEGSIWISGTYHCIHQITYILLEMGYYIINEVSWFKPNAAPNMGCRCFTASHETLIWAKKTKKFRHTFNYELMKEMNDGKQMRSMWLIPTTPKKEKMHGKHPTQKPLEVLKRVILSSSNEGDVILDPFVGSGTTGVAALMNNRRFIGIDKEKEFLELTYRRLTDEEINNGNKK
ncbi:DNA-methyltransferase [Clostridium fungisolvens]|uniref:Methyltransferase n=1 Tax=Clostridium fungisolvens TaxID=1604897 RepID=A0A6V8SGP6_9CLOT|nr:site-specific DNA-methyltransferase [Clostridium fungisolvens]GFP76384.1 Modification methylase DpnIIB [Clostridium fungisolvens]